MSDLIDRQTALDALDQYRKGSGMSELLHWNAVKHVLSHVPSAEPEKKKGKWVFKEEDEYCCSICKNCVISDYWDNEIQYDYCPYCGAEMEHE